MDGQRKKERNRNLDRLLFECVIKNAPTNDIERESEREREVQNIMSFTFEKNNKQMERKQLNVAKINTRSQFHE